MESNRRQENNDIILPRDVVNLIFTAIPELHTLGKLRLVSKLYKNVADNILTRTETVIKILSLLSPNQAKFFITNYYLKSEKGKALYRKPPAQCTFEELLLHLLIYKIKSGGSVHGLSEVLLEYSQENTNTDHHLPQRVFDAIEKLPPSQAVNQFMEFYRVKTANSKHTKMEIADQIADCLTYMNIKVLDPTRLEKLFDEAKQNKILTPKVIKSFTTLMQFRNAKDQATIIQLLSTLTVGYTNLSGIDLSTASLKNLTIRGIALRQANFRAAIFNLVSIEETDWKASTFLDTDIKNSSFRNSNFENSAFGRSQLFMVDFTNSNLVFCVFITTVLTRVNFNSVNLSSANFQQAIAMECNFHNAKLVSADFIASRLINCNLSHTDISNADFTDANLTGCDMRNTLITQTTIFHKSVLTNTQWVDIDNVVNLKFQLDRLYSRLIAHPQGSMIRLALAEDIAKRGGDVELLKIAKDHPIFHQKQSSFLSSSSKEKNILEAALKKLQNETKKKTPAK